MTYLVEVNEEVVKVEWCPADGKCGHDDDEHANALPLCLHCPPVQFVAEVTCQLSLSLDDECDLRVEDGRDGQRQEVLRQSGLQ